MTRSKSNQRMHPAMLPIVALLLASKVDADIQHGRTLVWSDEFTGLAIDPEKWTFPTDITAPSNNERQTYRSDCTSVANGFLSIAPRLQPVGSALPAISSIIKTFGIDVYGYGLFAARIKMPKGSVMWPSFWLLSDRDDDDSEVHIAEMSGRTPNTVESGLHLNNSVLHMPLSAKKVLPFDLTADFHVYAVEFTATAVIFTIDDLEIYRNAYSTIPGQKLTDATMYLYLNVAVGGDYFIQSGGAPNDAQIRQSASGWGPMVVDYVRVFKPL